ncbi:hypothetical protein ABMA28_006959 [Loxostege sticticalis]|uniref:Cytochrome P450 n=1 Tax=Loxostege sticticalis TaxID=481309 RepID=A0ABD0TP18_LOXSC
MIAYLLIAIIVVLCFAEVYLNQNKLARKLKKIPGPKDVFIVGNGLEIIVSPVELFKLGRKYANKWKGIYRIWAYPFGAVNIYNPEDIEIVVSTMKHSEKSPIYKLLKPWLRDGLLLSSGTKWQQRRKILTPTFHFNILRQFYVTLEENSRRLVEKLSTTLGEPVNVTPLFSEYTLNSICETAMGTQLSEEISKSAKSYKEAIYKLGNYLVERFVRIYLYSDFLFNFSTLGKKQKKALETIHRFTEKVIHDRKSNFDEQKLIYTDDDDDEHLYVHTKKKKTAMLDLLISAEREGLIDDLGIKEEVDTFMFEGHDTTAVGLSFFLMLLANNKGAQEKIVTELYDIFGDSKRPVSVEDLPKMKYLECCIKESLRLYPPVHFISRTISETVVLSNYTVPAGSLCHIHIYDLHRREDLFKDALKFDPDRFLPENCIGRHPYAYIPFSAGPRNCIGQKFAIMEMKCVVATILRNYTLLPVTRPSDIEIIADIVMRNNGPINVKFERRI